MNREDIKRALDEQVSKWRNTPPHEYFFRHDMELAIKLDFLTENNITERSNHFNDEVDAADVAMMHSEALMAALDCVKRKKWNK